MADVIGRYFCHECNVEKDRVRGDFTCPTCSSGFIEEMPARDPDTEDRNSDFPHRRGASGLDAMLPGLLSLAAAEEFQVPGGASRRPGGRYQMYSDGPMRPLRPDTAALPMFPGSQNPNDRHFENFLQELIMNVTGMGVAGGGGGGRGGAGGGPSLSFHLLPMAGMEPGLQIHGNPGDYAWGRGGLDTIITQLLNQMEGAGPPPMTKENINEIPTVAVSPDLLEKNPNCSVCWEDFKLEELVMKLECNHCFHKDCIVPWLELHGTCPVCRKVLIADGADEHSGSRNQDSSSPDPGSSSQSSLEQSGGSQGGGSRRDGGGSSGGGGGGVGELGGGGGLSGFIQSTLGSILGVTLSSAPESYSGGASSSSLSSSSSTSTTTSASSNQNPTATENNSSVSSAGGGSTARLATTRSPPPADEDTPASRRQRLDSDFVDFDPE